MPGSTGNAFTGGGSISVYGKVFSSGGAVAYSTYYALTGGAGVYGNSGDATAQTANAMTAGGGTGGASSNMLSASATQYTIGADIFGRVNNLTPVFGGILYAGILNPLGCGGSLGSAIAGSGGGTGSYSNTPASSWTDGVGIFGGLGAGLPSAGSMYKLPLSGGTGANAVVAASSGAVIIQFLNGY
jgi:hypothetical protein